ncbi:MAG TPA: 2-amino-4-hydroxy-6-hydroxymethyldihydropteridine diphosphokinase [Candidatus Nanopelagicaceae bacterium]
MKVVIALGSNMGDSNSHLHHAIEELGESIEIQVVSSFYKTAPVGGPVQDDFLNAVLIAETMMDPLDLLVVMQEVEVMAGRTRDLHWGPRTLDLDLISYGDMIVSEPHLTLPHPRAFERAFVLEPWLEIDPTASLIGCGPIAELLVSAKRNAIKR